jgi:hypothetical protein
MRELYSEGYERHLFVFPDGVYGCCMRLAKIGEIGESLTDIVGRALYNPVMQLLGNFGVRDTLKYMKSVKMIDADVKLPECSLCEDLWNSEEMIDAVKSNVGEVLKHFIDEKRGKVLVEEMEPAHREKILKNLEELEAGLK